MTVVVSVVVPTYHRPALLERCLAALVAQECDPAAYEIVVVDDAASHATRRQVERWQAWSPATVRYVAVTGAHGPAAARNRGWQSARGAIVAFTDDDCLPAPDWLRAGVTALRHDGERVGESRLASGRSGGAHEGPCLAGVWGRTIVPLPPAPTDYERDVAGLERAEAITANCFYHRAALAVVGGFDERFAAAWREDSDLSFTLLERGWRVEQAPAAVVTHPVRPARWGISLCQQRKSFYNALLYKKHPVLYRRRIQATPPWLYYGTGSALLVALIGILNRRWLLAGSGAAAWLGLTARFCARRLQYTSTTPTHRLEMVVTSALIPPLAIFWRLRGALHFRVLFL